MEPNSRTSSSPNRNAQDWQCAYGFVLQETKNSALSKHIEVAETAVLARRKSLEGSSDHHAERKAMEDALAHLRFLRRSRLGFGDTEEDSDD